MFEITESTLGALFGAYHFPAPADGQAVLFGVRGALPIDATGSVFAPIQALEVTETDYLHMRCTIGIWKRGAGLALFPASTLPHKRYLNQAWGFIHHGEQNNQLLAGYHRDYVKGSHPRDAASTHRALRNEGRCLCCARGTRT